MHDLYIAEIYRHRNIFLLYKSVFVHFYRVSSGRGYIAWWCITVVQDYSGLLKVITIESRYATSY